MAFQRAFLPGGSFCIILRFMERELFSRGMHAKVHPLDKAESRHFPNADLIRVECRDGPYFFKRLFYRHRIAHLLFPQHFIDVLGVTAQNANDPDHPFRTVSNLYSKRADVIQDHATYAAHMQLHKGVKKSLCSCDACKAHRLFHAQNDMTLHALKDAKNYNPMGIHTPWDDDSDYCLAGDKLVYFEIESFDHLVLGQRLDEIADVNVRAALASLLGRYKDSLEKSRQGLLTGSHSLCC